MRAGTTRPGARAYTTITLWHRDRDGRGGHRDESDSNLPSHWPGGTDAFTT